jgi:hypothetical protein
MIGLILLSTGCGGALIGLIIGYTRGWEAGLLEGVRRAMEAERNGTGSPTVARRSMTTPVKGPDQVWDYTRAWSGHKHQPMDPCTDECYDALREDPQ